MNLFQVLKWGAEEKSRERRPNGNSICVNGHKYPSKDAIPVDEHKYPSKDAIPVDEHLKIELAKTEYVVEANGFEYHSLWKEFNKEYGWEENLRGHGVHVGDLAGKPVYISLRWAVVNEINMLFWYATSMVVDYGMIKEWFANNCDPMSGDRHARCDAMNFSHALHCRREA
jgi:hypothetical protein